MLLAIDAHERFLDKPGIHRRRCRAVISGFLRQLESPQNLRFFATDGRAIMLMFLSPVSGLVVVVVVVLPAAAAAAAD